MVARARRRVLSCGNERFICMAGKRRPPSDKKPTSKESNPGSSNNTACTMGRAPFAI